MFSGISIRGGLDVPISSPGGDRHHAELSITEEAAITARPEDDFRVEPLVAEGDLVAQGAPVLRSRRHFAIEVTAPMPGRVAGIELGPGHRLSSMRFFREPEAGRHTFETHIANRGDDPGALRDLLLASGLWRSFRSRPFGRVPLPAEEPAAIFVMALDTRPLAVDPRKALDGQGDAFERGLHALLRLTKGKVFLCQDRGPGLLSGKPAERIEIVKSRPTHPLGLAGIQIHHHRPSEIGRPVWDLHAEDVAAIGSLLETGHVPETKLVSVDGPALRTSRLIRCQPGADLKQLCRGLVRPGPHTILSGSPLDGREAHWLGQRDRQVSVVHSPGRLRASHWFLSALNTASRPAPLIPTAALDQAIGGVLPAMPFLRALASGDSETFVRLGGLSLIEEDMSLVDYVTRAEPSVRGMLREMLHRIRQEEVE